jgi:hypothetical protein
MRIGVPRWVGVLECGGVGVGGIVSMDSPGWFLSESCSLGCGEQ